VLLWLQPGLPEALMMVWLLRLLLLLLLRLLLLLLAGPL
jgi:hypothetical protein